MHIKECLLLWFQQTRNLNVHVSNFIFEEKCLNCTFELGVIKFSPTIGKLTYFKLT